MDGRSEGDTLYSALAWDTPSEEHEGDLTGRYLIRGAKNLDYFFDRSIITIKNQAWEFNDAAWIQVDSTRIDVHDFKLFSGNQYIEANGLISEEIKSKLDISLSQIELSQINNWISNPKFRFDGEINGDISLVDPPEIDY